MNYLITGAARGIGRALAISIHSAGHNVFLLDSSAAELQHTLGLLSSTPAAAVAAGNGPSSRGSSTSRFAGKQVDVSDMSALRTAVAEAMSHFGGRLDVLINNAMAMPHTLPSAPSPPQSGSQDTDDVGASMAVEDDAAVIEHWNRQIAVGLSAPFHLTRLCVPYLRRSKGESDGRAGCVINVGSTRASMAEVDHEGYSAAKAGLLGLGQSMSVSLGLRYGIRVNSLVLGWIDVGEQNADADAEGKKWGEDLTQEDHKWHPAGRVGRAEDVSRAVQYLVESDFVTGSEVVVDGGVTRRMVYPE